MNYLSIGKLATQAEMSIDTIRYYEREGLIPPPARRASGYRDYAPEVVGRLKFIRRAKDLGFTLGEIAELLTLTSQAEKDMAGMKLAAQAKLALVDQKIQELQRIQDGLKRLVEACPGHGALATCPIVNALSQENPS
jgi:MerR family transcriptional regulator, copper efflux regulator